MTEKKVTIPLLPDARQRTLAHVRRLLTVTASVSLLGGCVKDQPKELAKDSGPGAALPLKTQPYDLHVSDPREAEQCQGVRDVGCDPVPLPTFINKAEISYRAYWYKDERGLLLALDVKFQLAAGQVCEVKPLDKDQGFVELKQSGQQTTIFLQPTIEAASPESPYTIRVPVFCSEAVYQERKVPSGRQLFFSMAWSASDKVHLKELADVKVK